jgi:hypothetical protein
MLTRCADGEKDTAFDQRDQCGLGVSLRPRIAVRGSLELYGIVGASWHGDAARYGGDAEAASDSDNGRTTTRIEADGGLAIQKWILPDLTLSADAYIPSMWLNAYQEKQNGVVVTETKAISAGISPWASLGVHLYW